MTFSNRRAPFSGAALKRPAVLGQPFGIGLTELRAGPQPTVPSAAGQGSPAAAASDQDGATDSNSGDSPAPVAALGDGPAPSDALAGSLPGGSQASPTDSLLGPTDSTPAPLSGGATPSSQTGLADEPADDEGRQGRRVRFAAGRTSQFVRKPPSFRPRVADTFARSHSRPDGDEAATDDDTATPLPGADGFGNAGSAAGAPYNAAPLPGATQPKTVSRTEDRPDKVVMQAGNRFRTSDQPDGVAHPSRPLPIPSRFHLPRPVRLSLPCHGTLRRFLSTPILAAGESVNQPGHRGPVPAQEVRTATTMATTIQAARLIRADPGKGTWRGSARSSGATVTLLWGRPGAWPSWRGTRFKRRRASEQRYGIPF